ncbi:MAG: phosphoribosylglycinamide formyltransferase [Pseudomonadota bacterium]|nr:phosphoribosylglycinamide formyltransferase [Pseudomonadota bacterium]
MKSAVILISGRGSNLRALLDAKLDLDIRCVVSNRPDAPGLEIAHTQKIKCKIIDHRQYASRELFDAALANSIDRFAPDYVILAGFLRIFTSTFVLHYHQRMINIHPSLLPAFTGLDTHTRALAAGVKIHGCTVHFVTPDLDGGPIIIQAAVPVLPNDTKDSLAQRVLTEEHKIYPKAISWLISDRIHMHGDQVLIKNTHPNATNLISPWN